MTLFHHRILKKNMERADLYIPEKHLSILERWHTLIDSKRIYEHKETSLSHLFINDFLYEILGYQGPNVSSAWNLATEVKIGSGRVDVALGSFSSTSNQIIAPFELKGAKTRDLDAVMHGRYKSPVQQAWEYAMDAPGAQWVLVSNYIKLRLYAVGSGRASFEEWDIQQLTNPKDYHRFLLILSSKNLLQNHTKGLLEDSKLKDKEITKQLYKNYKSWRLQIINILSQDNPQLSRHDIITLSQTILDRILFIAFAEDRGLLPSQSINKAFISNNIYKPVPIWDNFKGLFEAVDKGNSQLNIPAYNGGLFRGNSLIDNLVVRDPICDLFKKLSEYNFEDDVSVNVLGHIFEQSIADLEELHAESKIDLSTISKKRKQEGVVYTPEYVTNFIVENTLGSYLQENFQKILPKYIRGNIVEEGDIKWKSKKSEEQFWKEYQQVLRSLKVVDPACGSGAFLVAAFDYLYNEYKRVNDKLFELTGSRDLFDLDKEILTENLYGVDINAEAIEIAKLSLWLKTAKRGKSLASLDDNICVGNSLIDNSKYTSIPFNWQQKFTKVFAKGGFDVVLGNPPYVRQELLTSIKPYLEKHYQVYTGIADLYFYFFELGYNILKLDGKLGFISSNTFFRTGTGEKLRDFIANKMSIETVIHFNDLQIFDGVHTLVAISVLKKCMPIIEEGQLRFLSIKELPEKELNAELNLSGSYIKQSQLTKGSWQFENDQLAQLRQKIIANKPTLKEVYGSPCRGVVTGFNEAFIIDRTTRDNLIKEDPKSIEILKPILEGKDIKKWHSEPRDLWLIFTRRGVDIEQYPAIKEYLLQFKERLEPKPSGKNMELGRKSGNYKWYEIQDNVAYYKEFSKTKIVYAHFQTEPSFFLDKENYFSNDKSYILATGGNFELGLLSSKLVRFVIMQTAAFISKSCYELRIQYMEKLPIPNATQNEKQAIGSLAEKCQKLAEEKYKIQTDFRRRIIDLCNSKTKPKLSQKLERWWELTFEQFSFEIKNRFKSDIPLAQRNDWEQYFLQNQGKVQELFRQIKIHEQEINKNVYTLFELTKEEVQLLEANINL